MKKIKNEKVRKLFYEVTNEIASLDRLSTCFSFIEDNESSQNEIKEVLTELKEVRLKISKILMCS